MRRSRIVRFVTFALLALVAGCATRVVPPLPVALAYPEFVYPTLPQPLASADAAERIDRGWRFLQNGDLGSAEREFTEALQGTPALYPARAGGAYVALARGDYEIEGFCHVAPGGVAMKRLEQGEHPFISLTTVLVTGPEGQSTAPFLAVNRSHISAVQEINLAEGDEQDAVSSGARSEA